MEQSDKVVCLIGFSGKDGKTYNGGIPEVGKVYVVKRVVVAKFSDHKDHILSVFLVGKELMHGEIEMPWPAFHFKKLKDIQHDNIRKHR